MGTYTEHGLYEPEVGEIGWGIAVDENFTLLDPAVVGGGGGGGFSNLIDATQAPYSADPTGGVAADVAIQNAFDAAFNIGPGSGVYLPGIFNVSSTLAHFEIGGLTVYMPMGAKFVLSGAAGGKPLFTNLGRHGYGENQSTTDLTFIGITADGSNRASAGHVWGDWWQGEDHHFIRTTVREWKGSVWDFTGCRRPRISDFLLENCGDAENGAPAIDWHHSDEGGVIGRLTEYGTLENGIVKGTNIDGDFGVFWALTAGCQMRGVTIDGSGSYRSGFYGVDMDSCILSSNRVTGATEDGIHLQSRGNSRNNVVTGNVVDLSGDIDIHEASYNSSQTHTGNVIENNVGTVQRD